MMRENHNTQSCDYIFICQDGLYIASTEELLHILKDKYKINIYLQINIHMILVEQIFVNSRNILKKVICQCSYAFQ